MAVPTTSTQTNTSTGSTSVVITKPTGLAAGDLMVGYLITHAGSAITFTTPSGWTSLLSDTSASTRKFSVFTKVADSGDVAASNFTFSTSIASNYTLGILTACQGVASGSEITASEIDTGASGTSISLTGTSTPATTDSLVLMSISGYITDGVANVGSYTSTPSKTWTELAEVTVDSGVIDPFVAVASATSGSTSQITNYGATLSTSKGDVQGTLIIVRPPTDATGTNALLSVSPTLFSQNGSSGVTGTNALLSVSPTHLDQSGSATSSPVWSNDTKPSTAWTNPDK